MRSSWHFTSANSDRHSQAGGPKWRAISSLICAVQPCVEPNKLVLAEARANAIFAQNKQAVHDGANHKQSLGCPTFEDILGNIYAFETYSSKWSKSRGILQTSRRAERLHSVHLPSCAGRGVYYIRLWLHLWYQCCKQWRSSFYRYR